MIKPKLEDNVTEHASLSSPDLLELNTKDQISVSKTMIRQNVRMNHSTK
jgi:hypothetical protein